MTNREAVIWLINITADIGKAEHSDLWHYQQALFEIIDMLEGQPEQQRLSDWKENFKGYINAIAIDLSRDDYYAIMEYIDEVPSAPLEQLWTPCSERLPDVAHRVLLSGHGCVMVGMLHSFDKYSLEPTGLSYVYPKDGIEAWMPLPEPWEGEKDD